jgi:NitT/TauT family transport system ATP-binding protein
MTVFETPKVRGADVRLRDVTHLYQRQGEQVVARRDVHLHVGPGGSVALLGPSGSGKSRVRARRLTGVPPPSRAKKAVRTPPAAFFVGLGVGVPPVLRCGGRRREERACR